VARKSEAGLGYFPLNSDIVHNPKVKLVVAEFGPKAWAVLLPLYCKIYREKGYWLDWMDEDSKLLFAQDDCKCELSFVDEVVAGCIRRGLFNKAVFDMYGVLTSDRIQGNYFEGKKRSKEVFFIEEFLVENDDVDINAENVNIIPLNVDIITKKVDTGTQKRRRRRIEGEEEGEGAGASAHTQEEKEMFKAFTDWVDKYTPRVNKMKQPITIDEYLKLRKKLSKDVLTKLLTAMQNRADLLRKYVSAYLTVLNWASREEEPTKGESNSINDKLKAAGKKVDPVND
jgi:uncharacterized protein DUF4373